MTTRRFPTTLMALVFCLLLAGGVQAQDLDQDVALGQEAAAQLEAQYPLVRDPAVVGRVQSIGQRLAAQAQHPQLPWTFKVIDVPEFNALAFPGGFIYATRGLVEGLSDEELAFVLAHEVVHSDRRHTMEQISQTQWTRLALIALVAGVSQGEISQGSANVAGLVDAVIGNRRSQSHETEADAQGMLLMSKAGWDPVFAVAALDELARRGGGGMPNFLNSLLGSHPLPADRVTRSKDLVMTVPYRP